MEQDILQDLRQKFAQYDIDEPDLLVWLRPTFVFRKIEHVQSCIQALLDDISLTASRTVVPAENRLYHLDGTRLTPDFDDFGKSMVRRQDMPVSYKVFSTDVFRFRGNRFEDDFLGQRVSAIETDPICGLDIDDLFDFEVVRNIIENMPGIVSEYL